MSEYFLGDVFDFIHGGSWSESEYADSGIHVVKVTNMVNGGIITRPDDNYLPELKYDKYKAHKLEKNDILIATVGSHPTQQGSVVGRISLVLEKNAGSFLNQNAVCLRLKKYNLIDSIYFYHISKTIIFKWYIESRAKGSANQVRMALGDLKKFKHDYPEFKVQQAIAGILSAYDDLIENNKRRIALLENMAEELYREWFVRFRFPGWREAEFEKGIPKGWEAVYVEKLIRRLPVGKRYEQKNINPVGLVPVLDQGQSGIIGYHNNQADVLASAKPPVIVFANHTCYQRLIFHSFSTIQNVLPFVSSDSFPSSTIWLHYATNKLVSLSEYKGHWPEFVSKQIYYPSNILTNKFEEYVMPMLQEIEKLKCITVNLVKTKNALLPRLISGKLAVEDLAVQLPPSMHPKIAYS